MKAPLEFDPRLAEETVRRAVRGHPEEGSYHSEREPIYEMPDPEARDLAFDQLNERWFRRLELGGPVLLALSEQGAALASVTRCLAVSASSERGSGAELFVADSRQRSVVIRIRPETLVNSCRALEFLRRELTHVADMLDPTFEYEPRLPRSGTGPPEDRLLRDRYSVLWRCSVDGRLVREGKAGESLREERLSEFRGAFAGLGGHVESCFERIFSGPRPTHPVLLALALEPEVSFRLPGAPRGQPGRCGLCGFPTTRFEAHPEALPAAALSSIRSDFPTWRPEAGLCLQCADLYLARSLSEEEPPSLQNAKVSIR